MENRPEAVGPSSSDASRCCIRVLRCAFRSKTLTGSPGCEPCRWSAATQTGSRTRSGACRTNWSPPWNWCPTCRASWPSWRSRWVQLAPPLLFCCRRPLDAEPAEWVTTWVCLHHRAAFSLLRLYIYRVPNYSMKPTTNSNGTIVCCFFLNNWVE